MQPPSSILTKSGGLDQFLIPLFEPPAHPPLAQVGFNARRRLFLSERFGDVVHAADLEGLDLIPRGRPGRSGRSPVYRARVTS